MVLVLVGNRNVDGSWDHAFVFVVGA
jgi:hypothetical protein